MSVCTCVYVWPNPIIASAMLSQKHHRSATSVTLTWRDRPQKGQSAYGAQKTSRSCPLPSRGGVPLGLEGGTGAPDNLATRLETAACALLRRHCKSPFNFSLLNLAVRTFNSSSSSSSPKKRKTTSSGSESLFNSFVPGQSKLQIRQAVAKAALTSPTKRTPPITQASSPKDTKKDEASAHPVVNLLDIDAFFGL
jgi:hypothetical protein